MEGEMIRDSYGLEPDSKVLVRPPSRRLFYIFIVNENIGYLNIFSYLLACFATILLVAYLGVVQPFILTVILGITGNTGNITGSLALYDEIIALPFTLIWGIMSDRVGRRPVYSIGFVCLGGALIAYPYVNNIYPQMLLCRLLFSVGSSAATCMMTGTLGDIAGGLHERGRVSGAVGLFSGVGGLIAGMVLTKMPYQLTKLADNEVEGIQLSYGIVGGCAIALGVIFLFTMPRTGRDSADGVTAWAKGLITREKTPVKSTNPEAQEAISPWRMLKYGIVAGRDPRVALAYMSSFVSRADTVLFTSYMSLWVVQHFADLGYCRGGKTCYVAAGATHTLTGYGQGIALAFAPVYGYASEKFKKSSVLAFAGLVGAIGSLPFAFTKLPPADPSNFAFITLTGIGQMGMIVTGMTLVNGLNVDPKYRGSVAGVFSFTGALSIMIMARLGGYLFDVWMRGAPFVLMGIAHLVIMLMSIYVSFVTPRLEKEDRERQRAEMCHLQDKELEATEQQ